ncbi:MAG: Arm DNA-binding domain-containing protein, partial [Pseudomonadales bacterium]|nr:Arm DNA-binding domain-containing protein [Pseudomonadales bacterium]
MDGPIRLTDAAVERMKPPASGRREVFDAVVPGLSVRITSTGVRSWALRYRIQGESRQVRETIGRVGVVSLTDARERARAVLALAA